jgi:hypothetical protein
MLDFKFWKLLMLLSAPKDVEVLEILLHSTGLPGALLSR